ncbi:MAG TPA: hypothetical protein VFB38_20380 [Chthonomonadaceae bacterium]|nr:hypothetical protein [Chthonomonadaceae bacterium]
MKQKISGPVAVVVIVVAALAIVGGLYMTYFHETKLTPQESKARMEKGMQQMMQQRYQSAHPSGQGNAGSAAATPAPSGR